MDKQQERQGYYARGGPFDGHLIPKRFPEGFIAVDKPNDWCWIYDFDANRDEFVVRNREGEELDNTKRVKTADESRYDVLAVP